MIRWANLKSLRDFIITFKISVIPFALFAWSHFPCGYGTLALCLHIATLVYHTFLAHFNLVKTINGPWHLMTLYRKPTGQVSLSHDLSSMDS